MILKILAILTPILMSKRPGNETGGLVANRVNNIESQSFWLNNYPDEFRQIETLGHQMKKWGVSDDIFKEVIEASFKKVLEEFPFASLPNEDFTNLFGSSKPKRSLSQVSEVGEVTDSKENKSAFLEKFLKEIQGEIKRRNLGPTQPTTKGPTGQPQSSQTISPSSQTISPSSQPTGNPSSSTPTITPTLAITVAPTFNVTISPTNSPTANLTLDTTTNPPTLSPTVDLTSAPTSSPEVSTLTPTTPPTTPPTFNFNVTDNSTTPPTISNFTLNPTGSPTGSPTILPRITSPTTSPTNSPVVEITAAPTVTIQNNSTTPPTISNFTLNPSTNPPTLSPILDLNSSAPTSSPEVSTLTPTTPPTTPPTFNFNVTDNSTNPPTISNFTLNPSTNPPTIIPSLAPSVAPTSSTKSPSTVSGGSDNNLELRPVLNFVAAQVAELSEFGIDPNQDQGLRRLLSQINENSTPTEVLAEITRLMGPVNKTLAENIFPASKETLKTAQAINPGVSGDDMQQATKVVNDELSRLYWIAIGASALVVAFGAGYTAARVIQESRIKELNIDLSVQEKINSLFDCADIQKGMIVEDSTDKRSLERDDGSFEELNKDDFSTKEKVEYLIQGIKDQKQRDEFTKKNNDFAGNYEYAGENKFFNDLFGELSKNGLLKNDMSDYKKKGLLLLKMSVDQEQIGRLTNILVGIAATRINNSANPRLGWSEWTSGITNSVKNIITDKFRSTKGVVVSDEVLVSNTGVEEPDEENQLADLEVQPISSATTQRPDNVNGEAQIGIEEQQNPSQSRNRSVVSETSQNLDTTPNDSQQEGRRNSVASQASTAEAIVRGEEEAKPSILKSTTSTKSVLTTGESVHSIADSDLSEKGLGQTPDMGNSNASKNPPTSQNKVNLMGQVDPEEKEEVGHDKEEIVKTNHRVNFGDTTEHEEEEEQEDKTKGGVLKRAATWVSGKFTRESVDLKKSTPQNKPAQHELNPHTLDGHKGELTSAANRKSGYNLGGIVKKATKNIGTNPKAPAPPSSIKTKGKKATTAQSDETTMGI